MDYGSTFLDDILGDTEIIGLKQKIVEHTLFQNIQTQKHMRIFMEHHVFQVWDFMILLKSIQFGINSIYKKGNENFSCWFPKVPGKFCRLITEICLDEESDNELGDLSHFEYYLKAMEQSEADMYYIEKALSSVRIQGDMDQNVSGFSFFPSKEVEDHFLYMRSISNIVSDPERFLYKPLASFCVCREGLIPDFFSSIIRDMSKKYQINNNYFIKYLTRHIELDGDEHSEKGYELLGFFLDDDNIEEAIDTIKNSLKLRLGVLDSINKKVLNS